MSILNGLNERQTQAVTAPINGRLQVVAGPGTGKTKVLCSRVAYMIVKHGIKPHNILVTTFTKKASNEMKERLESMLKSSDIDISGLYMGTFHSICYRILSIHGGKIGLSNYRVADENDSMGMLNQIVNNVAVIDELIQLVDSDHPDWLPFVSDKQKVNASMVRKQISSLKAQGISSTMYSSRGGKDHNKVLEFLYEKYTHELNRNKRFDFDDCLLYCYQLLVKYPVMNFIQHVVVDEFQDTNSIQLKLMFELAKGLGKHLHNVTVVGDPDQSIYAFRGAQSVNFQQMKDHYKSALSLDCDIITLNENYRSTTSILNLSEQVMRQASGRHQKTLKSHLNHSFKATHAQCENSDQEAQWIAFQIDQLLLKLPIQGTDIAILVRSSNETRVIEKALTKKSIPYKMLKGRAFWNRSEVMTVVNTLRVIADHNDSIAIFRCLSSLKGVGDSSISNIQTRAQNISFKGTMLEMIEQISLEVIKTKKARDAVKQFINRVKFLTRELQQLEHQIKSIEDAAAERSNLLQSYFDTVIEVFELNIVFKEEEEKQANIDEVRTVFSEFIPQDISMDNWIGSEIEDDDDDDNAAAAIADTQLNGNFLVQFVDSIGLYQTSDDEKENSSEKALKPITLSTIHGSKGLEWKIVFVPGLTEGIFPSRFSVKDERGEAIHEERRCFYVALTRAKWLLYLSSVDSFGTFNAQVSRFIRDLIPSHMVSYHPEILIKPQRLVHMFEMCNSTCPSESLLLCQEYQTSYHNEDGLPQQIEEENCKSKNKNRFSNDFILFTRPPAGKAPSYTPVRAVANVKPRGNKDDSMPNKHLRINSGSFPPKSSFKSGSAPSKAPVYVPIRSTVKSTEACVGMRDTRAPTKRYAPHYVVDRSVKKSRAEES
ncbi:uncharacterized protein KQ657_002164 [Scheffersomyces spartinae]|uniref:DNA 3'-5' helicase n=1 Tax=Scheffersomyces spartinae TaxID=45513 RepID=A0A9P7VDC0_9ASCO|nr:uncharacterized protein KQ657_002164 [Scheffersomyces spartinae]KAG7195779.1 hypothetical protein KQ657_002164 [Scheffersomyces spartinae]